jgi:hypothetical protein
MSINASCREGDEAKPARRAGQFRQTFAAPDRNATGRIVHNDNS